MVLILCITKIRRLLHHGFPPAPDARDLARDGIIGLKLMTPEMKAWNCSAADHHAVKRGACRDVQGVRGYTEILKDAWTVGQYRGLLPPGLLSTMPGWPPTTTRDFSSCSMLASPFFAHQPTRPVVLLNVL